MSGGKSPCIPPFAKGRTGTDQHPDIRFWVLLAVLYGFALGVGVGAFLGLREAAPPMQDVRLGPVRPTFADAAEEQEFDRLQWKHGLKQRFNVVLHDPLGPYYIRDGRRYKFQ